MKKVNKALFKAMSVILSMTMIIAIVPFHIYANENDPFIGINWWITGYDADYVSSLTLSSGTGSISADVNNVLLVERTSQGVTYQTSTASVGSVTGNGGHISGTINANISGSSSTSTYTHRMIKIQVILDDTYVGSMRIKFQPSSGSGTSSSRTIYFNGNMAECEFPDSNSSMTNISYNISVDQLDITHYYNGMTYDFPYESLNFIVETAQRDYEQIVLSKLGHWIIPIFDVPANSEITHKYLYSSGNNDRMTVILWCDKAVSSGSSFANYFTISNGELVSLTQLNTFQYNGVATRIVKLVIRNNGSSTTNVYLKTNVAMQVMPIYCHSAREMGYETQDFCDNFGLSYGGAAVQESLDNADDMNSDLVSSEDDLFSYEDTFGENLDDSLQSMDNTIINYDPGTAFGSKFLYSSNWVRSQFEAMTSNTPFGSVLSFSLLLGIALLIIGKVFK